MLCFELFKYFAMGGTVCSCHHVLSRPILFDRIQSIPTWCADILNKIMFVHMCYKSRIIFDESMIFLTIMPNTILIQQHFLGNQTSHVDQVMNKNKHINLKGKTINQQKIPITKYNESQFYKIDIYEVLVQRCNIA